MGSIFIDFDIWVLAVKLDSGSIGVRLGPLQSLTSANFQYPSVSMCSSRMGRVRNPARGNQTLTNLSTDLRSQYIDWRHHLHGNWVLSDLEIGQNGGGAHWLLSMSWIASTLKLLQTYRKFHDYFLCKPLVLRD